MSFPLLANPNRHYYTTRRGRILGIVLHVTAGLEDFTPPDLGAESTIRYGLANESAEQNKAIKSADLIGIRPVLIEPRHVGHTIGQFVSREVKKGGWVYTGKGRETAQMNWVRAIVSRGGDACFCIGEGTL